jgi:hypothetical protein
MKCKFCGEDDGDLLHAARCDGRQGAREAAADAWPSFDEPPDDVPMLISGLVPETRASSTAAAVAVLSTKDSQRAEVEAAIKATRGEGITDDGVQVALGLDGSSERPRRWELWKQNRITVRRDADGNPVKRLTRHGIRAVVWIAVEFDTVPQQQAAS